MWLGLLLSAMAWGGAETAALPPHALPVPITPQATDYSCGAAAVLSVLTYWNAWAGHEVDLYGLLETTNESGTHPRKMMEGMRVLGLQARMQEGMTLADLRTALSRGETVILDIQAWPNRRDPVPPWKDMWNDGHYIVLTAMDRDKIYAMDPSVSQGYAWMPQAELLERWHDYEDRYGQYEKHQNLGIIVSGQRPLRAFPAPLIRLE